MRGGDVRIFGAGTMANVAALTSMSSSSSSLYGEDKYCNGDTIATLEGVIGGLLSGGVQRKPKMAKGTRDYLPEQMMIHDQAFQIIRRVFKSHASWSLVQIRYKMNCFDKSIFHLYH